MRDLKQELAEAEEAINEAKRVKTELAKEASWRAKNHATILQRAVDSLIEIGTINERDWGVVYEDAVARVHAEQAAKQSSQESDEAA